MRVMHIFMYMHIRNNVQYHLDSGENIYRKESFIRDFIAATVASIFLHPLHLIEARYIL